MVESMILRLTRRAHAGHVPGSCHLLRESPPGICVHTIFHRTFSLGDAVS